MKTVATAHATGAVGGALPPVRGHRQRPVTNSRDPMPSEASGRDEVRDGRLRRAPPTATALGLWVSGDQLLKGAAFDAMPIAEQLWSAGRRAAAAFGPARAAGRTSTASK